MSEEYLTIILPVVFCAWENPSLGLREEYRLRVFQNTVLRKIFGPKREEVRGEWRRLHNEELYNTYSSQNIIHVVLMKKNVVGGACDTNRRQQTYIQGFGEETGGKQNT